MWWTTSGLSIVILVSCPTLRICFMTTDLPYNGWMGFVMITRLPKSELKLCAVLLYGVKVAKLSPAATRRLKPLLSVEP